MSGGVNSIKKGEEKEKKSTPVTCGIRMQDLVWISSTNYKYFVALFELNYDQRKRQRGKRKWERQEISENAGMIALFWIW